jgi:anti-sigma B factor antagonist
MQLTTEVTGHDGYAVVVVAGELDLGTASDLLETLTETVKAGDLDVILDLAGLEFCDSAGLAVFVRIRNELDAARRRLVVAGANETVTRILDLSGVSQVIPTVPDTPAAVALVNQGPDAVAPANGAQAAADPAEPTDAADPAEPTDAADPAEPTDAADPAVPTPDAGGPATP